MKNILYSILSGLLLAFSWPNIGNLTYLIFIAFVPILFLTNKIVNSNISAKSKHIFLYSFLTFFIFNILTTYWIFHATLFGAISAFIINSLLMSFVFFASFKMGCFRKNNFGTILFIVTWIAMEYLHLNWDLSWPWLILGNVFASTTYLIQWYEFTGVLGGTLLILLINILFLKAIISKEIRYLKIISLIIFLVYTSRFLVQTDIDDSTKISVVVVQPNIDPYNEKFTTDPIEQITSFIELAKKEVNDETDLLIGPETAIQESIWENNIDISRSIDLLKQLQLKYPKLNIIIGASTYKYYKNINKKSVTARKLSNSETYYDAYNSAIFISSQDDVSVYHKTKLVPGVEKIPFPFIFNNFSALSVDLGGVSGSLGSDNTVNYFSFSDINILPLICYESIYGDIIANREPDILCVITNDGWWQNTAGYKQHFQYSRLRAIEQRRSVVRSANTGISGVIDVKGEVIQQTDWDEEIVFSHILQTSNKKTFYNKYGDYIGRVSMFIFVIFVLITIVKKKLI